MRDDVLRWIERGLIALGAALAVWCAAVLIEARFVASLRPPRHVPAVGTLPGEGAEPAAARIPSPRPHPAPAAGSVIATLVAPSLDFSATVLEGSDDRTLRRGAGHLEDTPLPGEPGNVGIAGHRDTTFRAVRNLHVGDELDLLTGDHTYHYQITKTFIVEPEDVYVLDPGRYPMLTLVTCYPFEYIGHAPHRYIVQAVLIDGAP